MPLSLPTGYNVAHYVYILTNKTRTVLYIGVTGNLEKRIRQHRDRLDADSFTSRYRANRLVYYEKFSDVRAAIAREKQLKKWSRVKKNKLIENENPEWNDLFVTELGFDPPDDQPYQWKNSVVGKRYKHNCHLERGTSRKI